MALLRSITVAGIGIGLTLSGASALATKPTNGADWWQWALATPIAHNPLIDPTGADCAVGQSGDVWFLAGTFGGGSAVRSCTIPAGKEVFFPVINAINIDTPGVCGQEGSIPIGHLRQASKAFADAATNLSVELDGHAVSFARKSTPPFAITLPADNLFDLLCNPFFDVPAGTFQPSVDDGFYASLHLSPGTHTLHFHAEVPAQNVVQDIVYNLVVTAP